MTNQNATSPIPQPATEALLEKYYAFLDDIDSSKRVVSLIGWGIIAIILMVGASIDLGTELSWVNSIIGVPAGIITFLIGVAVVHYNENLQQLSLFTLRERLSARARVPYAIGVAVATVIILLLLGSLPLPFGLGGTIVIVGALTAFNIARRSWDELKYAAQGIPDPRELTEDAQRYIDQTVYEEDEYDDGEGGLDLR